jgi:hypothetical protein
VQLPVLGPGVTAAALTAGLATAAPYWTAASLVQSLRHDMVCRPEYVDPEILDPATALPAREAIMQALAEEGVAGRTDADPAWVRDSWVERAVAGTGLPGSTVLSTAIHLADQRARRLLGW